MTSEQEQRPIIILSCVLWSATKSFLSVCHCWVLPGSLLPRYLTTAPLLLSPPAFHQQLWSHNSISSRGPLRPTEGNGFCNYRESSVTGAAHLSSFTRPPPPHPCTHRPVAVRSSPLPWHVHAYSLSFSLRRPREVTFQTPGPSSIPPRFRRKDALPKEARHHGATEGHNRLDSDHVGSYH